MPRLTFSFLLIILFHFANSQDTLLVEKDPHVIVQKVYVIDDSKLVLQKGFSIGFEIIQPTIKIPSFKNGCRAGIKFHLANSQFRSKMGVYFGQINLNINSFKMMNQSISEVKHIVDTTARPFQVIGNDTIRYYDTINRTEITNRNFLEEQIKTNRKSISFLDLDLGLEWFKRKAKMEYGVGIGAIARFYSKTEAIEIPVWNLLANVQLSVRYYFGNKFSIYASPAIGTDVSPSFDQKRHFYLTAETGASIFF